MLEYREVKAVLQEKLMELEGRAQDINGDLDVVGDVNWSELAAEAEGDEVLERVGSMTVHSISEIKRALRKIDDGSYGECSKCNGPIGLRRLEALPYAITCVKCA